MHHQPNLVSITSRAYIQMSKFPVKWTLQTHQMQVDIFTWPINFLRRFLQQNMTMSVTPVAARRPAVTLPPTPPWAELKIDWQRHGAGEERRHGKFQRQKQQCYFLDCFTADWKPVLKPCGNRLPVSAEFWKHIYHLTQMWSSEMLGSHLVLFKYACLFYLECFQQRIL